MLLSFHLHGGTRPPVLEREVPKITILGHRESEQTSEFSSQSIGIDEGRSTQSTLAQILKKSASIHVQESGGEGAPPILSIRGQDPIQTRFFLEGMPLTDAQFNSHVAAQVPLETLSGVDIYPAGIPAFLGEDGLGGGVNLRLLDEKKNAVGGGARGGSYEFGRVHAQAISNGFVHLDYSRSNENFLYFDDNGTPFNPDDDSFSRRDNNRFRKVTAFPVLSLLSDKDHRLRWKSLNTYGETEIPGPIRLPMKGKLTQFYHLSGLSSDLQWDNSFSQQSDLLWRVDLQDLKTESPSGSVVPESTTSDAMYLGLKTALRWKLGKGHELGTLSGISVDRYRREESQHPDDKTTKHRLAVPLGISAKLTLSGVELRPAILSHYYDYSISGTSAFDGTPFAPKRSSGYFLVSPRLAVICRPFSSLQLRSSVGSFYRAPSMVELHGSSYGITPSPELLPEHAFKGEWGFDAEIQKPLPWVRNLKFSYTYFFSRARDLIIYQENSRSTQVASNVGIATLRGHEIQTQALTRWNVGGHAGISLLHTENSSDISYQKGKELPRRPFYTLHAGLNYVINKVSIGYAFLLRGPFFWDVANLKQMGVTSDHGLNASWDTKDWGTLSLEIRNLFNTLAAPASFSSLSGNILDNTTGYPGYPAPGRRMYISWKYEI